jgi:hypothetical protein
MLVITKTSPPVRRWRPWYFAPVGECSKTVHHGVRKRPNILKKRVLFAASEFHSGTKHATTMLVSKQGAGGGKARAATVVVGL